MSDDGNNHSKSRRDLATEFTPYQKAEQHRETLQKEYYFLHNHAANRDTTNRKVDHNMTISYTNTVSSTDRMHRTMGDHEPRCRYQFDLSDPKGEMCRRCKRDHITCKHKADKHLSPQEVRRNPFPFFYCNIMNLSTSLILTHLQTQILQSKFFLCSH
eukprot:TRINITY_DN269_c0_g2_i6.p1 TRINITY_DN269_c0_g2~~TRINITY_DN269_c0_g2_i6.p1  ORF type:complete len:158 (-),score=20.37 TRINITY_DN269_c0_g2_i6:622-1095(-)